MVAISLQDNFCLIEPKTPLTAEDFEHIAQKIDPIIEKEGNYGGLLVKTKDFPGWQGFSDALAHYRFVKEHHRKIRKIAFVTDAKIADVVPDIAKHFVKAEVKHFAYDQMQEAIDWID